jgi:hypothetical protein
MPKDDDAKGLNSPQIDRRLVIGGVLAASGLSALGAPLSDSNRSPEALVAEREWARTLARSVANQLPEAARQIPGLCLTESQIEQLRKVFENTLVVNMGCELPPR